MIVKYANTIILTILGVFVIGLYLILSQQLNLRGEEILKNWIKSSSLEIQQGNLLSSFTRNKQFILSSDVINGMTLYGLDNGQHYISLGNKFSFEKPEDLEIQKSTSQTLGFFHNQIFYRFKKNNLLLIVDVKSAFLQKLYVFTILIIFILFGLFNITIKKVQKEEEEKRTLGIIKIGKRLKHDISSAMSTVVSVAESSNKINESDKRSLLSSYERVGNILSDIDFKNTLSDNISNDKPIKNDLHFSAFITDIYHESIVKARNKSDIKWGFNIPTTLLSVCIKTNKTDLSRCIHNLIDNAVDAVGDRGNVDLSLQKNKDQIQLKIHDNGVGISGDDLKKIGTYGFSKKNQGQGLGIYHAKKCISAHQGFIEFQSEKNNGTTVIISLPLVETPELYKLEESFFSHTSYVLIDDDVSVFDRFKKSSLFSSFEKNLKHYPSTQEYMINKTAHDENTMFLVDYDIKNSDLNGVEFIKQNSIQNRSLLVTSYYDDPSVITNCRLHRIKIFPKNLIEHI